MGRGYRRLTPADEDEIWARLRAGHAAKPTARALGLSTGDGAWLSGAVWRDPARAASARIGPVELGRAGGDLPGSGGRQSLRAIAAGLGRAPSTVSREVAANGGRRPVPGRTGRSAGVGAGQASARRASWPPSPVLRAIVAEKLSRSSGHRSRSPAG